MKKALIASTALVLTAGVAAADVTISGYGRTGIIYLENIDDTTPSPNETQVISRLRMNIDATTSTDQGVEFGGRFRLQWDQNNSNRGEQGQLNAGKLFVTASGLTVEIGNVDTAFDSAGLAYASELGSYDRSIGGNPGGSFFAYSSDRLRSQNYMGVMAKYSVDALTVRASYVDPDQTGLTDGAGFEEELGISADYTWNDRLELSAAAVNNGSGLEGNDQYF
uniref:porin n=1 Tax=Paracoccus sp. TaxID=267 RepID=UPI00396C358D